MNIIKILFLDIDGVLNSIEYFKNRINKKFDIDITKVSLLKEIIDKTGAKIVLSSSWRLLRGSEFYDQLPNILDKYQISIFDYTGYFNSNRTTEIKDWLTRHPETENYCILDDDDFHWDEDMLNHWVKPSFYEHGIDNEHVAQAIKILKRKL